MIFRCWPPENQRSQSGICLPAAADAGYVSSMYAIGRRFELGNGVDQNAETAIAWYQKAAERLAGMTGKE